MLLIDITSLYLYNKDTENIYVVWGGENIFNLTKREEQLLKTISNTGYFFEMYLDKLNISMKIVYNCINKGFITRENTVFLFTNLTTPYCLTNKGKDLVKNMFSINPYRTNLNQVEHDYVLGSIYVDLSNAEQNSWQTETSLMMKYPGQSIIDAMYTDLFNDLVGVEIITEDYSDKDINAKLEFIRKYCEKKVIIYTKDILKKGRG